MTSLSKIVATTLFALSFATPVLAPAPALAVENPESAVLSERNVYLFTPDGRMIQMKANDKIHALIMKEFKPIKGGTMIYVSGGKFYMVEDNKMASGKMLSDEIYGYGDRATP